MSKGCRVCLKYWVKGICYNDCKHRGSHSTLSDEEKQQTEAYIQELQGGLAGAGEEGKGLG